MGRAVYPRIGDVRSIVAKQARRPLQHKKTCAVCGAEATHEVWIQVSWFRGDDESTYACGEHRQDARLLNSQGAAS